VREDEFTRVSSTTSLIIRFEYSNVPQAQTALHSFIIDPIGAGETPNGKSEITRHELTFDDNGFAIERRYQDNWGTPRHDAQSSFGQHLEYSARGLVTGLAEIGEDGREITLTRPSRNQTG
jgi:hypothetical protein